MAEEIIFKIGVETGNGEKEVANLQDSMEGLEKSTKNLTKAGTDLSQTFEEANNGLAPMTSRLGEMEDRMHQLTLEGKAQSQEFMDLQAEVVRYKQAIIETDRAVDVLTEQGRGLGAALQLGSAAAAGYGALEGSMVALGIESEGLTQSFVKLQAIQTVLASLEQLKLSLDKQSLILTKGRAIASAAYAAVQGIVTTVTGGATAATVALGVAMMALPIVGLIAGIVAIIAALSAFTDASAEVEEANNRLSESYDRLSESIARSNEKYIRQADNQIRLAQAQGASREELHDLELEKLMREEQARVRSTKFELSMIESRRKNYKAALQAGNDDLAKEIKEEIAQHRQKYKDLKNLDGQYIKDREILQAEFDRETKEKEKQKQKEAADAGRRAWQKEKARREKAAQLKIDLARKTEDLMIASIEDEGIRTIETLRVNHQREREELIKKFGEDSELLKQLTAKQNKEVAEMNKKFADDELKAKTAADKLAADERKKAQEQENRDNIARLQLALMTEKADFEARIELAKEQAELERDIALQNTELTEFERLKIQEDARQKLMALDEEVAQRNRELTEAQTEAIRGIVTGGLEAIDNLSSAIFDNRIAKAEEGSKKELELQKKAFKVNKAFQLGQATIQGIQAVQSAYATAAASPITIANPIYPKIMAGIAAANSLANILKIKATTFSGGGGSVSSPQTQAPTVGGGIEAATTGADGESTLTAGLPGSGTEATNKVVIVDSDIKASQDNLTQIQTISSIGG